MLTRRLTASLAIAGLLATAAADTAYAQKIRLPGGKVSADAGVCQAERAPLLERQEQYKALRRTRIAAAAGQGVMKGATFFAGAMLSRYGIPGLTGGQANVASGAAAGGLLGGSMLGGGLLGEARGLSIPGVTLGAAGGALGGTNVDTKAIAALSVVVAIAGTVEAYVRLKQEEAGGDRMRMARSIDGDARLQIDVSRAIAAEQQALSDCLERQITDIDTHLASASNDKDRRSASQRRAQLTRTVKSDLDLTTDVVDQQATLAKTFTQGRAMTEGKSEAQILGGQQAAYAESAGAEPLDLPQYDAPAQPAAPSTQLYLASRATIARAKPEPNARSLANFDAGDEIQVKEATRGGWHAVLVNEETGYVRSADVTRPPAGFAAPVNIREHNRAVIQARHQGPDRLKTLLTGMQAA